MDSRVSRRPRSLALVALAIVVAVLVGQAGHAPPAKAAAVGFCGGVVLGQWGNCSTGGSVRTYQDYGWGDQHSVCVLLAPYNAQTTACSGGPGQGVYSGQLPPEVGENATPFIANNAPGANTVHGVYLNR
jgi:hypothetical protein